MGDPLYALPRGSMETEPIVCTVLHRRFARQVNMTHADWTPALHWRFCGQSCPCCRAAQGEFHGSCEACAAGGDAMMLGFMIASLVREEQNTKQVVAALGGQLGLPGRPLPHVGMTAFGNMLPSNITIYPSAGLAGLALLASGMP